MNKMILLIGVLLIGSAMSETFCPRNQNQINLFSYFKGIVDTLELGLKFDDINNCLYTISDNDNTALLSNITNAMNGLSGNTSDVVIQGLQDITLVNRRLPTAMTACTIPAPYITAVNEMLNNFTLNPVVNLPAIQVQTVDIATELNDSATNWAIPAYYKAGVAMGSALAKVYWGRFTVTDSTIAPSWNGGNWSAGVYPAFSGKNLWDFKKMINLRLVTGVVSSGEPPVNDTTPPADTLDGRIEWPNCIHPVRDAQNMGAAWAMAPADVLADRFCIKTARSVNAAMSVQYILSCQNAMWDGDMYSSWKFLESNGDVTDACLPYDSGSSGNVNACSTYTKCADNGKPVKYHAQAASTKWYTTPLQIRYAIFQNGPVEAAMYVYSDFPYYQSGIYKHVGGLFLGAHPVRIIGWGIADGGEKYWIAANNWGTTWGESGYFRILEGEVGIDSQAIAGVVDLSACDL